MALRTVMSSRLPMVIILGATGTGKTKLGVELAQKYGTEIISADSMQIYKGLDIVTAKATPQERELVPHHLLDILEPHQNFTVVDFRGRALKIIDKLTEQGKLPIIVGGTNYYIESIVYKILVEDAIDTDQLLWEKKRKRDFEDDPAQGHNKELKTEEHAALKSTTDDTGGTKQNDEEEKEHLIKTRAHLQKVVDDDKNFTNEEIHDSLKSVDPEMASRLHPNNRRKVCRAIEVWLKSGQRHSELLEVQKTTEGQLRVPGILILWLKCEQAELDARLDARVDTMLEEGLIAELLDFHDRHNKQRITDEKSPDYTKGIFQTLGFKEFHDYLMLPDEKRNNEEGRKLLSKCIDNMKTATRRYARRQNKMTLSRFLEHPRREAPHIFELDTTCLSDWDESVKNKAIHIIESFLHNNPCKYQPLKRDISEKKIYENSFSSNFCHSCNRLIMGDAQYEIHLHSNKHMKLEKKKKRVMAASKEPQKETQQ